MKVANFEGKEGAVQLIPPALSRVPLFRFTVAVMPEEQTPPVTDPLAQ